MALPRTWCITRVCPTQHPPIMSMWTAYTVPSFTPVEVGYCANRHLNYKSKQGMEENLIKYERLMTELRKLWKDVAFVAVPVGGAGTYHT
eukprot:scaffold141472_cov34-Prasinocladus_malaysianus.AAC.1